MVFTSFKVPRYAFPFHTHNLPYWQHLATEWYVCYNRWTNIHASLSLKVHSFISWFILPVVHCADIDRCLMICMQCYSIRQKSITVLKILLFLPIHLSSPILGNHWSFNFLHSFVFSRKSYSWGTQYVALLMWFLSRSSIHSNFICVFAWFSLFVLGDK